MNVFDGCVLVLVSGCEENRSHGRSFGNPDGALCGRKRSVGMVPVRCFVEQLTTSAVDKAKFTRHGKQV
jgi:hypothetical protein